MKKKKVAIAGGGAAGIMLAMHLNPTCFEVHLFEKTSRLGRKLLVAGKGGFNLTFDEPLFQMQSKYLPEGVLDTALESFTNADLCDWLDNLGVPTYVGSSGRVFPVKGIKPFQVLDKMRAHLEKRGVQIHLEHEWKGWKDGDLVFDNKEDEIIVHSDHNVFALGGGSWSKTGSDGSWLPIFSNAGIKTIPLQASNCGWKIDWEESFINEYEGKPIKNMALSVGPNIIKGEIVLTATGVEGSPVYALANAIRSSIEKDGYATLKLDLKPSMTVNEIIEKLTNRTKSVKHVLIKELRLSPVSYSLLMSRTDKTTYNNPKKLATVIKRIELNTKECEQIDKVISTVGGIALREIDEVYQLKSMKDNYVIGEMLDWDTRTGGYLLQACFSMGVHLSNHLNNLTVQEHND